jgi:hypothetical protein
MPLNPLPADPIPPTGEERWLVKVPVREIRDVHRL